MEDTVKYEADGTLVLSSPVQLPDVLDMLIVGGGPAGTAAAFRAKELGIAALVIDFDDLLRKIRNFEKNKEIKPNYGGDDETLFPKGGELVSLLHFEPTVASEMWVRWKSYYRDHNVPAKVGIELVGLEDAGNGITQANVYNLNTKKDEKILARHVVLAIGRGVPNRFDVPGNTSLVGYRMEDANDYVDKGPVCVAGGGTSAAEAVIAISNAKARAGDKSSVYWSYRGDKRPKVSKALAEEYFTADMGNGNIVYKANSEPAAVLQASDGEYYLSIRTDRRVIEGRPVETDHLEFLTDNCLACLGESIPESFLEELGIGKIEGGKRKKKRLVISPFHESKRPNVYLVGDLLCLKYFESPSMEEKNHEGNIKAGLIDGVIAAEVIAQKLQGKQEIDVKVEFADAAPAPAAAPEPVVEGVTQIARAVSTGPIKMPEPSAPAVRGYLNSLFDTQGGESEFALNMNGPTTIGRKSCDIVFPEDRLMGDHNATITHSASGYVLQDDGGEGGSGVYVRVRQPHPIGAGSLIRAGKQFLALQRTPVGWSLKHYNETGSEVGDYPLAAATTKFGRKAADVVLDADDGTLSRNHFAITVSGDAVTFEDLGSLNGTFRRIDAPVTLSPGAEFRVGSQSFQLTESRTEKKTKGIHLSSASIKIPPAAPVPAPQPQPAAPAPPPPAEAAPAAPAPPAAPAEAAPAAGPALEGNNVRFTKSGQVVPFTPGQTLLEIAAGAGEIDMGPLDPCKIGECGVDPVKIVSGQANLNDVTDVEDETIDDKLGLEPGEYRLACQAKPTGPVEVELMFPK